MAILAMDLDHIDTWLALLSVSGVPWALPCLPRLRAPQSVVLTTGPSHMSARVLWYVCMWCI